MQASELPIVQALGPRAQEITTNIVMLGGSEIASWAVAGGACYTAAERGLVYTSFPSEYSVDAGMLPWVGLRPRITRVYDAQNDITTLVFDSPVGSLGAIAGGIFLDQAFEQLVTAIVSRAGR